MSRAKQYSLMRGPPHQNYHTDPNSTTGSCSSDSSDESVPRYVIANRRSNRVKMAQDHQRLQRRRVNARA